MQYIPFILATAGNYIKRFNTEQTYTIYFMALMILASFLALCKVIIMVVRTVRDPITYCSQTEEDSKDRLEMEAHDNQAYP